MKKLLKAINFLKKLAQFMTAFSLGAAVAALLIERSERDMETGKETGNETENGLCHAPYGFYEKYIKRPLDAFLAAAALIALSPVLLLTAAVVRIRLGTPVLFTQDRPGRNERVFKLYKFRTMTDERDENGQLLPDEERLTAVGKSLRSTSLDELPELFNILKGDMAIVGPRPLLVRYLGRYNEEQRRRHEVRPGLTGYAQVHGRNSISWQQRFGMDVQYVDHITFLSDIKILFDTVKTVVTREGISSETAATMEEFMGNEVEDQ